MGNIVAIVGRPNVGKSTLFNRLTQSRQAIIHESSGVTRDRHYGKADWNGVEFSVIDTGGYVLNTEDIFEEEIKKQVKLAIEEADRIIFVVDVTTGITEMDTEVAGLLRRFKKTVYLVVNKVDNGQRLLEIHEFYNLGLDSKLYPVSSINGSGTGELLDDLITEFEKKTEEPEEDIPRFAVVGRPNVGKSSLINALIGQDRNIVTEIAGTTRDSIHTRYQQFGHDFYLVDTAGLRKKGKVHENIEFYSVMRSVRAIEEADVCLLMLDATQPVESQDLNIFHLIHRNGKGVVVLVNKWDIIEKDNHSTQEFIKNIHERISPFVDVPIVFTSAITKQRVLKALEEAIQVYENRKQRVPTSKLNEYLLPLIENQPPPATKGKYVRIKYISMIPGVVPSFVFYCNLPQYVKDPYKRFLENKIRGQWNFSGVPIRIFMRKK
jgi:GTP-binding protein